MNGPTTTSGAFSGIPEGQIGTIVTVALLVFIGISALIGFLFGLKRGLPKATVRLCTVIVAIVGAFLIAMLLGNWFIGTMENKTIQDVIRGFYPDYESLPEDMRNIIGNFDAESAQYLLALPLFLVAVPAVFIVLFYVLKLITLILFWIISAIAGMSSYKKSGASKFGGGMVGLIQGVLVSLVVLIPIVGYTGIVEQMKPTLTSAEVMPEETAAEAMEVYDLVLDDIVENPVISVIGDFGGNAVFNLLTTARIGEEQYSMSEQTVNMTDLMADIMAINAEGFDWQKPIPHKTTLYRLVSDLGDNPYVSTVVSGLLRSSAFAIEDGIIPLPEDEPYKTLTNDVLDIFETSTKDNLEGDLNTILKVYMDLAEFDVLTHVANGDSKAVRHALIETNADGERLIYRVIEDLRGNERTKALSSYLTRMSLNLMATNMGLEENTVELYDNVKAGANDILAMDKNDYTDDAAYTAAVATEIDTLLTENNIDLGENKEQIVNNMAQYVNDEMYDELHGKEITDEDVDDLLLSYYDAYADALASGDLGDLEGDLGDLGDLENAPTEGEN